MILAGIRTGLFFFGRLLRPSLRLPRISLPLLLRCHGLLFQNFWIDPDQTIPDSMAMDWNWLINPLLVASRARFPASSSCCGACWDGARIWGRNDPFFLPVGAEAYQRDIPNAEIRILDTGHFALETHAVEIAAAMRDFLSRVCGR